METWKNRQTEPTNTALNVKKAVLKKKTAFFAKKIIFF